MTPWPNDALQSTVNNQFRKINIIYTRHQAAFFLIDTLLSHDPKLNHILRQKWGTQIRGKTRRMDTKPTAFTDSTKFIVFSESRVSEDNKKLTTVDIKKLNLKNG